MSAIAKQIVDASVDSKKTLGLMTTFESPHLAFPLAGRLMRTLTPIVGVLLRIMDSVSQDRSSRWSVAAKLVCDQRSRLFILSLKDLTKKASGSSSIASALNEDIEYLFVLINSPP